MHNQVAYWGERREIQVMIGREYDRGLTGVVLDTPSDERSVGKRTSKREQQ